MNAGMIIQEIGADSKDIDSSYLFERDPDAAYDEYSKSKNDRVWIYTYFSTKIEDVDDFDILAPGATQGSSLANKDMKKGLEAFKSAVNKEVYRKYGKEFNITTSESSEAMFFYINSVKPKDNKAPVNEAASEYSKSRKKEFDRVISLLRSCVNSVNSKDIIVTVMDSSWYNKNSIYILDYEEFIDGDKNKITIANVDCWTRNGGHDEPLQEIMKLLKQKVDKDPNLGRVYTDGYKKNCEIVYVSDN